MSGHAWRLAIVWLTTVAVHGPALDSTFALDDVVWLLGASGMEPAPWSFRPLARAFFGFEHSLFGLNPAGYHVVQLGLHLLNATLVYRLALRFIRRPHVALAGSVLFGASAIAFTPLHWAVGVAELLSCTLLLAATMVHLDARARPFGSRGLVVAAALGVGAVLAKEGAIVWLLGVLTLECLVARNRPQVEPSGAILRKTFPVAIGFAAGLIWLLATMRWQHSEADPYHLTFTLAHLGRNLATYVYWAVAFHQPIRDRWAFADPGAWSIALPVAALIGSALWRSREETAPMLRFGGAWFLVLLAPALPLSHHSYLYYLYVPWVGGSLALAALGVALVPRAARGLAGPVLVAAFVALEAVHVRQRERLTWDALPIDPTQRQSLLLERSLLSLRSTALPEGATVGFVNPAPRASSDLLAGAPSRANSSEERTSYYPLERVMLEGRTLRLFVPGLSYAGFRDTIPRGWEHVEIFLFEQRGSLRHWGRGTEALERQERHRAAARHGVSR